MKEIKGDIWELSKNNAIVIPTNGIVKDNGELVMGAGIALEAKKRDPDLPRLLGKRVKLFGNTVNIALIYDFIIFSFPTKEHYAESSSVELIKSSAIQLVEIVSDVMWQEYIGKKTIYLPHVGCGLGGLDWNKDVKPILSEILDDRFVAVEYCQ